MKHKIEFFFFLFCLMFLIGCVSGKEVLVEDRIQINAVNSIAIIGFPGQCTYENQEISFFDLAVERIDSLNRFETIIPIDVNTAYQSVGLHPIDVDDEYSSLDVLSAADLCIQFEADAILIGFYRTRIEDTKQETYVDEYGQTVWTTSHTYPQLFPTFEICIIGPDGSLLFRGVSEGRETSLWNEFWDSLFESESDETFYHRVQDAMDGFCEMLKD